MNLQQVISPNIASFLAVARHLNFTEAASSLYLSQPAISKQISLLEKDLGVQLFFRTKRSVRLTPAGAVLYKELGGIAEKIEEAVSKSRQPNLGEDSTITIGVLDAMNTETFFKQTISAFKSRYPGIRLVLERHSFKALREKLMNGSIDVAFTMSFEVDGLRGILWDPVYQTYPTLVLPASHPLASQEKLAMSALANEDFVLISREESPHGYDHIIQLCNRYGFTPSVVKQLPNIESLLLSVSSGLGVTVLDNTVRNDNFKLHAIEEETMDVVIAWKKENLNPAVVLFTQKMLD